MRSAMPELVPLLPDRVRTRPDHFAWADHRLREHLHRFTLEELALLFFLHLAADRNGCSFWSDTGLARKLDLSEGVVVEARHGLIAKEVVAYRYPIYQLLELSGGAPPRGERP